MYQNGMGVPRDFQRAREYFERAAAKNDPYAFYNLSVMSFLGQGVPKDNAAGFAWLSKGVALHFPLCLYETAAIYYSGAYGVPVDFGKAMSLGAQAAALGDRQATWGVAKMYILGEGAPQDIPKGMEMMRMLSNQGFAKATDNLGELYADSKIRSVFFDDFSGHDSGPAVELAKAVTTNPSAWASEAVRRPATISATLSPFLSPINLITSGAFQAGSTVGAADCRMRSFQRPLR
jgi:TPR repeat protein